QALLLLGGQVGGLVEDLGRFLEEGLEFLAAFLGLEILEVLEGLLHLLANRLVGLLQLVLLFLGELDLVLNALVREQVLTATEAAESTPTATTPAGTLAALALTQGGSCERDHQGQAQRHL